MHANLHNAVFNQIIARQSETGRNSLSVRTAFGQIHIWRANDKFCTITKEKSVVAIKAVEGAYHCFPYQNVYIEIGDHLFIEIRIARCILFCGYYMVNIDFIRFCTL